LKYSHLNNVYFIYATKKVIDSVLLAIFMTMNIERIDDLPLIHSQFNSDNLIALFNTHFPDHGNWLGISGGHLLIGWLLYIMSESDHRLSHVEDWASQRMDVLSQLLGVSDLRLINFNDDRLANLLDRLADDNSWKEFEKSLSKDMLQLYKLPDIPVIRTDSFNVPQYRQPGNLFRLGYSKQNRSDMPFAKVMMSMLDEGMLPLSVDIIKGNSGDVDHYLPTIERTYDLFSGEGNLYVGDSQLGSLSNRSSIAAKGHYYLMPLNRKHCVESKRISYINELKVPYTSLPSVYGDEESGRKKAYYFEVQEVNLVDKAGYTWYERRILVYSPDYAQGLLDSLEKRVEKSKEAIRQLVIPKSGRKKIVSLGDIQSRVDVILKKNKVVGLLNINYQEKKTETPKQRYKDKPARVEVSYEYGLNVERDELAIATLRKQTGWQIYGTNIPKQKMTSEMVVLKYRDQYKIEHLFDYMLHRDVGLLPIFLHKEERIKGLIRLLTIAMRFVLRIQYQIRAQLKEDADVLKEVYPGNPGRATNQPTTPMILKVFKGVSMVIENGHKKMPPLSGIQQRILRLLKVKDCYQAILELSDS